MAKRKRKKLKRRSSRKVRKKLKWRVNTRKQNRNDAPVGAGKARVEASVGNGR